MGCGVLVIRRDDGFSELLREAGFEVENLELITTRPAGDLSDLSAKLQRLDDYDGLFFTSPAAAEVFVEHANGLGSFPGKIYVLGERARKVFAEKGVEVVFREEANTAEEFLGSFPNAEFAKKRMLFVKGDRSLRTIPELLAGQAHVDELMVYETISVMPDARRLVELKEKMGSGRIGWTCFFSPSGVDQFTAVFSGTDLNGLSIAAIGETTAEHAAASDLSVEFISERSNAKDFARGLIEHIKQIDQRFTLHTGL